MTEMSKASALESQSAISQSKALSGDTGATLIGVVELQAEDARPPIFQTTLYAWKCIQSHRARRGVHCTTQSNLCNVKIVLLSLHFTNALGKHK